MLEFLSCISVLLPMVSYEYEMLWFNIWGRVADASEESGGFALLPHYYKESLVSITGHNSASKFFRIPHLGTKLF